MIPIQIRNIFNPISSPKQVGVPMDVSSSKQEDVSSKTKNATLTTYLDGTNKPMKYTPSTN